MLASFRRRLVREARHRRGARPVQISAADGNSEIRIGSVDWAREPTPSKRGKGLADGAHAGGVNFNDAFDCHIRIMELNKIAGSIVLSWCHGTFANLSSP